MPSLLGLKGNMESRYNQRGQRVPVTILQVDPNVVLAIKDQKVVVGLGTKKKIKKPQNHFATIAGAMPRYIKEIKKEGEIKIGDKITVAAFALGDAVRITGTTKGHGFAGGIKRHGFHGGPKTHGQSDRHRAPGSIGSGTTPGRVYKGKRMAGHYGNVQFTVTGLEVLAIDPMANLLFVKGAVPGAKNGFVVIEKTGKVKKYVAPPEEKPKEDEEGEGESKEARPPSTDAEGAVGQAKGPDEPDGPKEEKKDDKTEKPKEEKAEEKKDDKKE
ncbi:MAG TPA: 50S ribosomal protein L3 [Candidatus Saccharimonadales bacterium]|nr:50S ribosomal protein L3 [Candidatus Saccharimonadales bacterium]